MTVGPLHGVGCGESRVAVATRQGVPRVLTTGPLAWCRYWQGLARRVKLDGVVLWRRSDTNGVDGLCLGPACAIRRLEHSKRFASTSMV